MPPTISNATSYSSADRQHSSNYLPNCILKWRQGQLLVSLGEQSKLPYIPAFETQQQLVECLKPSPIRLVCLHPNLGEETLKLWADACDRANKPVFLRGPKRMQKTLQKPRKRSPRLDRSMDLITASLLILFLSPVMLAAAISIGLDSPDTISPKQWYVGTGGKFFRLIQFPATVGKDDSRFTSLIRWMRKYNLDKLPQLFNVLRGDISLKDSFDPLTVSEALKLHLKSNDRSYN